MTGALQIPTEPMKVSEFLEWAIVQPRGRYELVCGEIVAMAPERARHSLTKHKVARTIEDAVHSAKLDCTVFPDGMTVIVDDHTAYEPDCVVQCGGAIDLDKVMVDDPLIVVEVLSPSTGHVDIAGKLVDYFRVPSITHYFIVDTKRRTLIHQRRDKGEIATRVLTDGFLQLDTPCLKLAIAELFIEESDTEKE